METSVWLSVSRHGNYMGLINFIMNLENVGSTEMWTDLYQNWVRHFNL